MEMYIGYQSALEYWRVHLALPNNSIRQRRINTLPKKPPPTEQVKFSELSFPVHIMLSNPKNRWTSKMMKQHMFSGEVPSGCFIYINGMFAVSSPEFCFIQMAGKLPLFKLIELGYELCGTYSLPIAGDTEIPDRGFHIRPQMTSVKKLSSFAANITGVKGQNAAVAKRALQYIIDGSASPMETKLSMLMTLPYKLGGFGLLKPKMNVRITPSKTNRKSSSKAFYTCDLFWPDHNLAVEYDSDQFHTGSEHITDDSKKRNSLTLMGVRVITVTTKQLYDMGDFEKVVGVVAKCLNKRLVFKNPGFTIAHRELRNQLL